MQTTQTQTAWPVVATYGTGVKHTFNRPTRNSARLLKKRLERNATLAGVPFTVKIAR